MAMVETIALGPERTREELIPFLLESVDDDDEVLLALAEQLGTKFVPLVGGPEFAVVLLAPLEQLASVEESSVREKAIISLNQVIAVLPVADVASSAWPIAVRLSGRDWFVSRMSAAGLMARLFTRLPENPSLPPGAVGGAADGGVAGVTAGVSAASMTSTPPSTDNNGMDIDAVANGGGGGAVKGGGTAVFKDVAFALFCKLCGDSIPMVRRAASAALADMGTALARGALPPPDDAPAAAAAALQSSRTSGSSSSSRMEDEEAAAPAVSPLSITSTSSAGKGVGAAVAPPTSALLVRDGLNVDTGDINSSAVPLPVPKAVCVRAASQSAGAAAATALLPLVTAFTHDEQDSVRLVSVDDVVVLARLVNGGMESVCDATADAALRLGVNTELREKVVAAVAALASDVSWRVRWGVANRLSELSEAVGKDATSARLLQTFENLIVDGEAEVRSAAAYRVTDVGRLLGRLTVQVTVLPFLERLAEDPSEHVRAALASVVLGLAPVLGTEGTISSLLPLFLRLLKDSVPQVRLNLICKLEAVNEVIGLRVLSQSLLPAIVELSSHKQWRVRLAIIEFMPLIGAQLGAEFFDSELTKLCVTWLGDSVHSIREAACANLRKLTDVFGPVWAERAIVPRILQLQHEGEGNYLLRQTSLQAAVTVCEAIGAPLMVTRLLPAVVAYSKDPVPNVRFNLAKSLERLAPKIDAVTLATVVKPTLQTLTLDSDADVKFYAARALASF